MANSEDRDNMFFRDRNASYVTCRNFYLFCNPFKNTKNAITVKPVLSGYSTLDKTRVLKINGRLMKVESIAELEHSAILLTFIKR